MANEAPQFGVMLERVVAALQGTSKYGMIAPQVITRIAERELQVRRSEREALKASKTKLHQIGSAYQRQRAPYSAWLRQLRAAGQDPTALGQLARTFMATHASTNERLPILDEFFRETLAEIAPVRSVLDVACGLNPLAAPWMPLAPDVRYLACDMYVDLMQFLVQALPWFGINPDAWPCDVTQSPFEEPVELALVLKTLPCLEQQEKGAAARLLERLPAQHILVSFPVYSLGRRPKGMAVHYDQQFGALIADGAWREVRRYTFSTELAFLLSR